MILPILYPDLVALARATMADPQNRELVGQTCDFAHRYGYSLEEASYNLPKADGFSVNSNRGLGALAQTSLAILAWRRENNLP